jgi:hypothetical protein
MNKIVIALFLIMGLGLSLIMGLVLSLPSAYASSAPENCVIVRATADARNPQISTERSLHRLHRYIADHLRSPGGKSVGPTSTHCIRNACESSAIVCQH